MSAPMPRGLNRQPDLAGLPPNILSALAAIAQDLRHTPRDCFVDRAELVHWLNRLARRVDGVAAIRTPIAPPAVRRPPTASAARPRPASARSEAEAVFGKAKPTKSLTAPRTITTRKGRSVRVETRRSRWKSPAQTELEFG